MATDSRGALTVVFASQTGAAQDAAECLAREAAKRRFAPVSVVSAGALAPAALPQLGLAVFVFATAGDGEVPESARALWRFLLRRELAPGSLAGLTVAVFGLGDSGYPKYNAAARKLWARLLQLGAAPLACGLGDDRSARGATGDLDSWLRGALWPALDALRPPPPGALPLDERPQLLHARLRVALLRRDKSRGVALREDAGFDDAAALPPHAVLACVAENRRLTHAEWAQDVRHIVLAPASAAAPLPAYGAGDVVVLRPRNPAAAVARLAARLGLDLDDVVSIAPSGAEAGAWAGAGADADAKGGAADAEEAGDEADGGRYAERAEDAVRATLKPPEGSAPRLPPRVSVRDLLSWHLDICGPLRRGALEQLALFAREPEQAEKLAEMAGAAGADVFQLYCVQERRTLVELLEDFGSVSLPLARLADIAAPLPPRAFSIASAPADAPRGTLALCVAVVDYATRFGRRKRGVCSDWLAGLDVAAASAPADAGSASAPEGSVGAAGAGRGCVPIVEVRRGPLSAAFALATASARPLLLVGPGTGTAPMRSMWRELAASAAAVEGPPRSAVHLFFGCRRRGRDWLYGEECERAAAEAAQGRPGLALYEAAFSREPGAGAGASASASAGVVAADAAAAGASGAAAPQAPPAEKDYVQARLRRHGALVADLLLRRGGALLVAGSAAQMPADVLAEVRAALRRHGGEALAAPGAAERALAAMAAEGRIAIEAW
jgi:sulfite reductase alpha subunit-like flavoprotein